MRAVTPDLFPGGPPGRKNQRLKTWRNSGCRNTSGMTGNHRSGTLPGSGNDQASARQTADVASRLSPSPTAAIFVITIAAASPDNLRGRHGSTKVRALLRGSAGSLLRRHFTQ